MTTTCPRYIVTNPAGMNRKQRRAAYAQNVKLATVAIKDGKPVNGVRGSLTGSNRSRPLKRFKRATGRVSNPAVRLLAAIHEWLEPIKP